MGSWTGGFVENSPLADWDIPCALHKKRRELRITIWEVRLPDVVMRAGGLK